MRPTIYHIKFKVLQHEFIDNSIIKAVVWPIPSLILLITSKREQTDA